MNKKTPKYLNVLNPGDYKPTQEFPDGAGDAPDIAAMPEVSRRKFLAILGAGAALTATACTDYRDKGQIIAYNKKPEYVTNGIANYYASTYRDGSPILIKTREGRPIQVVGNTDHPVYKGKISIQAQTATLDLYDPERLQNPMSGKSSKFDVTTWDKVDSDIIQKLNSVGAKEIALVSNKINSPSFAKLLVDFKSKFPTTKVYTYEHYSNLNKELAFEKCYGTRSLPTIDWAKADVILSLEGDILGSEGIAPVQVLEFTKRRDVSKLADFNRLYTVESVLTPTGMNSDYRLRLNPALQFDFVACLINEVAKKKGTSVSGFANYDLAKFANENSLNRKYLNSLVKDLATKPGKALVYAGALLPTETHVLVNALNNLIGAEALYNVNRTSIDVMPVSNEVEMLNLVSDLNTGKIGAIIHLDCNPVYHLPSDLNYGSALAKADLKIAMVDKPDETSSLCDYVLPINHSFESWGDYKDSSGLVGLRQPVIESLYLSRQLEAVLLGWMKGAYAFDIYHKYLMDCWKSDVYSQTGALTDFEKFWFSALHDGFVEYKEAKKGALGFNKSGLDGLKNSLKVSDFTVVLKNNYYIGDGRYADNGWLQEIPHPVSKVVWDNYAAIAPKTAAALGVNYKDFKSDLIEISVNGKSIKIPVMVQPGTPENVITIELGYGRKQAGTIGSDVGVKGETLVKKLNDYILTGAKVTKIGEQYKLVATQEHYSLEDLFVKDMHRTRKIIKDGTVAAYLKNPELVKEDVLMEPEEIEKNMIYPAHEYKEVKWAMAVDLNKCISCGQCVASCNVENNIAIVGKEEVSRGREMHWMRIDRYYSGSSEEPIASAMPMMCQHCDNAPCEEVCPVAATTHSPDGLNQMTYNRCVGTRYCANNCPFKVRRYNFFDFRDRLHDGYYKKDSLELLPNPEVTVRSRGVMEKCTFCVQRTMEARQEATKNGETFTGKGVETACQQACPANAIVFGNINDPNSEISKISKYNLGYKVLDLIGIKPNVTYVAKLKNTDEEGQA